MSRIVSTKLVAVHNPTMRPNHSKLPVRTVSTSWIGSRSVSATSGGSRRRTLVTVSIASWPWPSRWATAAATMKKGNSATIDR